ncbi:MAG: hypothetical protein TREMPRED_001578 [Tremellales sp. Tagirdzhanova-0007]|nr:MAG: hypothetical protein TREMPRED_001578 [Tremellales sp. Tagirdzhanova-0007]
MSSASGLSSSDPIPAPDPKSSTPPSTASPPQKQKKLQGWQHSAAGSLGGMTGAIVTSPFDVVKTRLQSDMFRHTDAPLPSKQAGSSSSGVVSVTKRLPKRAGTGGSLWQFVDTVYLIRQIGVEEGWRALYKGLGPSLVGIIPARAINFYFYPTSKAYLAKRFPNAPTESKGQTAEDSPVIHLSAAIIAGIMTATGTNPIWVVKTRLQLSARKRSSSAPNLSSTLKPSLSPLPRPIANSAAALTGNANLTSAASPSRPSAFGPAIGMTMDILRRDGIRGLYRGLSASYLGVSEGVIQWVLYERFKRISKPTSPELEDRRSVLSYIGGIVGASGGAKAVASLVTYPHEVMRTRLRQPAVDGQLKYSGLLQTLRLIIAEEGFASLYGGLTAHLFRVVPNAACMFLIYEVVAEKLGSTREDLEEKWLPKLGKLRVEREIVLSGYSLYSLRPWHLSRTHWSQTIVTQTGKPTEHISVYLLVPDKGLSASAAEVELAIATQVLATETRSQPRQTGYGTLLVTTPSVFGQDILPIPEGDWREARPYMVINTALRRLGCGGRAIMGMEVPVPAVRRKFYELYRISPPSNANTSLSRSDSPSTSPSKTASPVTPINATQLIFPDTFTLVVIELIKLIQSALAIWGLFGADREDLEIDGLFCDETKTAIFQWRRDMGMEHEESMQTSGGCIDPKTLAALLSSVTSVRYQLDVLGIEQLPKNPFTSIRRFLNAWHHYQLTVGGSTSTYLVVSKVRHLNAHYLRERTRSPGDALKMHRFLLSSVAQATSSISANLKGSAGEDRPLRKREHHLRHRIEDGETETGVGMIVPEGEIGPVAPPDVVTTDLEAYTKGIINSREKDWDVIGARRVAELWNGSLAEQAGARPQRRMDRGLLGRRMVSRELESLEEGEDSHVAHGAKGAFERVTARTGQALKGGFGLVSDVEEVEEQLDRVSVSDRALAWQDRGLATPMLRTASDGADVAIEENGMEWQVINPRGTCKGQHRVDDTWITKLSRSNSLQDRVAYKEVRVSPAEYLAMDVETCGIVLELRQRERQLAVKVKQMKVIEESVFKASQNLIDALKTRASHLGELTTQAQLLERELKKSVEDVDEDDALGWASRKIQFYLSEDTNLNEVMWNLRALEKDWERVRRKVEERRKEADEGEDKGAWWRFGL